LKRESSTGMDKCKTLAKKYICKLRNKNKVFNCPILTEELNNTRIIINKSRNPLLDRLCSSRHIPHPFIVQCIKQGWKKYFRDECELRKHLIDAHDCCDLIIRNYTVYALS
jgi:hypothetical protein